MADVPGKFYRATKVRTGVSPSSPGSIEGEPLPPVNPPGSSLNSVGLTMPSAFTVSNSPLTANGTIGVAGAGTVAQYIRGDGSLADFPESSGGGGSVSYYLNGSVNQGTIGGVAYKELNKVPILGAGTDFSISADGYIASFITDAGDPNLLEIPGGNWNFETYFSSSSSGGTPTFYVELYKYDGTTFTLIASSVTSPEFIAFGTTLTPYFSTLAVPTTTLALTDRLAIRYYVTHSGRTITLHTENNHLCQIITTFTTGLTALNGLTAQVQNFAVGTTGTDFNIASAVSTHTFNLPTASATNRGALSGTDWSTFNSKQNALSLTTTGTSGVATLIGATLNIPNYGAALSAYLPLAGGTMNTGAQIIGASSSSDVSGGLIQIRERDYVLNAQSAWSYSPAITFHWGLRSIVRVGLRSDGFMAVDDVKFVTENGGTWGIAITGNAGTVTNGVYTSRTITINGTTQDLSADRIFNVGTVTSVTASSPLASSGGTTPNITIQQASGSQSGFLSSTDWTTFNSKQQALNGTGFVKISGTTISYDNSTYLTTAAAASTYLPLAGGTLTGPLGGTSAVFSGNVTANDLIFGTNLFAARRYVAIINGISSAGYTSICNVTGNSLASSVKISLQGTANSTVVNTLATIIVNHFQDIYIKSESGIYTILTLRVISSNDENYTIQATTDSVNPVSLNVEVFPQNSETVVFSATPLSGTTLTHVCSPGMAISSTGGENGNFKAAGNGVFVGNLTAASFIRSGGTSAQFLKADGSVDSNTYLTGNQTITLSGVVTGSGTTAITTAIANGAITNAMLANSSFFIGTTSIALGRTSAAQTLSGVSIDGNAGTANTWTNARTITIGNTGKSVDGSANVAWSLAEIGAYAASNPSGFIALTALSGVAPIQYNNSTGAISITQASGSTNGFLSSTDWTTFNNKTSNVGTVTSVAALTLGTTGTDLTSTVANGTTTPVITLNVPNASATNRGALTAADWTTFNNKQNALTNPVTGTGAAGQVAFWNGTTTQTSDADFTYDSTTNILTAGNYYATDGTRQVFLNPGADFGNGANPTVQVLSNHALQFATNNGLRAMITAGGNFLIGTSSDNGARLQVSGVGTFLGRLDVTGTTNYSALRTTNTSGNIYWGVDNSTGSDFTGVAYARFIYSEGDYPLITYVNGSERMRIASTGAATFSGNVVLGTTALTGGGAAQWLTANGSTYGGGLISSVNGVVKAYYYYDNGVNAAMVQGIAGVGVQLWANNAVALSIATSGAATFSSSVNVGGVGANTDFRIYRTVAPSVYFSISAPGGTPNTSILGVSGADVMSLTAGGNVGINTTPSYKLHVVTDAVAGRQNMSNISRTTANWVRFTNPQYSADASMGLILRVFPDSDARQGAGIIASGGSNNACTNLDLFVTTSPDGLGGTSYSALNLNGLSGAATFSSSITAGAAINLPNNFSLTARNAANSFFISLISRNTSDRVIIDPDGYGTNIGGGGTVLINPTGGNVGIGTTTNGVRLVNSGATNSTSPTLGSATIGSDAILSVNGLYGLYTGVADAGHVWQQVQRNDGSSAVYPFVLQPSGGNVLIGTTTDNGAKLNVNGSISANSAFIGSVSVNNLGTGTVYSNAGVLTNTNPSDFYLKENIAPINYGLSEILKLNAVSFNWKNETINQGKQYGFIAQEVEKIMPDLVKKGEYLGLDKEAIFTTLVKAIQELKQEIDTLKN